MRILWVTQNGGNYKNLSVKGTGGWIGAMQEEFCKRNPSIELGITFFHHYDSETVIIDNVTYLPVEYNYGHSAFEKFFIRHTRNEKKYLDSRTILMKEKIATYNPDIIHVWGIENNHAHIINYLSNIPIIVHIQGFASACLSSFFAPGFSLESLKSSDYPINNLLKRGERFEYNNFVERSEREVKLFSKVKFWIGRTDWDKSVSHFLSPDSSYFHCDEILRTVFTNGTRWHYHYDEKIIVIQSTISSDWYKGLDVVLKTAKILHNKGMRILWNIYGWKSNDKKARYIADKLRIRPSDVGVVLRGCVEGEVILKGLLACDCYVHPSYIENSCNAIAEAQMIGVPVIAQYVGGNPSMLRDNSGILAPANDPYILASCIAEMCKKEIAEYYSIRAYNLGQERNNPSKVCQDLKAIYDTIISHR